MKRLQVLIFFVFIVGLIAGGVWFYRTSKQLYADYHYQSPAERIVRIEKGSSIRQISKVLSDNQVISNPYLFQFLVRYQKTDKSLKAGKYQFRPGITLDEVIATLIEGKTIVKLLTVAEGQTINEIAELLPSVQLVPDRFLSLACDSEFVRSLNIPANTAEGFLFPETYYLYDENTERDLIKMMVGEFWKHFTETHLKKASDLGYPLLEIITLASIVEKEAQLEEERSTIAAVYHNRLNKKMLLQADPTVQYAAGIWKSRLFYKDLEIDSPYNTYRYRGLPPGPICSPGIASINAAINPAAVDYLYFVARGDGSHIFSKNISDHNQARLQVKRKNRTR